MRQNGETNGEMNGEMNGERKLRKTYIRLWMKTRARQMKELTQDILKELT